MPLNLDAAEHISSEVRRTLSAGRFSVHGVNAVSARLQALSKVYADKTALTKRTIAGLEKELPPSLVSVTTQIEHGVQAREALSEYWSVTKDLKTKRGQLAKYKRWQTFVERAADDLCRAEADLSQARLSALGGKYQQLFQSIMLSGDVVPELKRSDMGEQLEVQLEDFHGRSGLSARALLSESYRNALAISVFLSAATTQPMVSRFVVLDDITSSFDGGHQWRLMDQIRLNLQYKGVGTDGLQFIMLSHDGLLEKYFDSVSSGPRPPDMVRSFMRGLGSP